MPLLIGQEQQVNTYGTDYQGNSQITALKDGGWLVTWESFGQDLPNGYGVYQRRYTSAGIPVGEEERVNVETLGNQRKPAVAALDNGGWVVTWRNEFYGQWSICQRIYDAKGNPTSGDITVGEGDADGLGAPSVTAIDGGGWLVTWAKLGDSTGFDVVRLEYDASGNKGDLATFKTAGDQLNPVAVRLADGGWVVTWQAWGEDGSGYGIFQAKESSFSTQVNSTADSDQTDQSVTGLMDGGWVVTWQSADGADVDIFQQRFKSSGEADGGETQVNLFADGVQDSASVTALADGGWVVTWQSYGQDGDGPSVYQQRFSKTGARIGGEMRVDAVTGGFQGYPATTALPDGGWIVTWEAYVSDGSDVGVFQRRFTPVAPTVSLTGTVAKELAPTGAVVGELPVAEPGDSYTYALLDSAGGRFVLSGNQLRVNKGILLDYEQAKTHTVTLMVTDAAGLSTTQDFTIKVANVSTEKTAGTSAADTVVGGGGKDTLGGGGGNDRLSGGGSTDTLRGGSGHDRLDGGTGKDTLTGNSGQDAFLFTTKPGASNVDTLRDFQLNDAIWLENAIFKGIGSGSLANPKKMLAEAFQLGAAAQDAEDRILYDQATGSVFYDRDGIGAAAAVKFAVVATRKALTLSDFYVI